MTDEQRGTARAFSMCISAEDRFSSDVDVDANSSSLAERYQAANIGRRYRGFALALLVRCGQGGPVVEKGLGKERLVSLISPTIYGTPWLSSLRHG